MRRDDVATIAKFERGLVSKLLVRAACCGAKALHSAAALRCAAVLACAAALTCAATAALGQAYTPPPPPLTSAPCVPKKKDPCDVPKGDQVPVKPAAEQFPFPGDAPAAGGAAQKFPFPGESAAPATTPAPGAKDTAQKFPFPGEPAPAAAAPSGSGGGSSSSSSSSVPDTADDAQPAAPAAGRGSALRSGRRPLPKTEDLGARESEDLEVSKYYVQSGDYLGAYNRAKDAVRLMPDDSEAHWSLAVAADKMKKPEEARVEYAAYLKAEPDGDHVRAATAALKVLAKK